MQSRKAKWLREMAYIGGFLLVVYIQFSPPTPAQDRRERMVQWYNMMVDKTYNVTNRIA